MRFAGKLHKIGPHVLGVIQPPAGELSKWREQMDWNVAALNFIPSISQSIDDPGCEILPIPRKDTDNL
jgi:hypothetical protein